VKKLIKSSVLGASLSISLLLGEIPRDEIVRAVSKQQYAPNIPQLRQLCYFKTAEEINAGDDFSLTNKLVEWDQIVQNVEKTLREIDAIRAKFKKPFDQKQSIKVDMRKIRENISRLNPTDTIEFGRLTSKQLHLNLKSATLEITIKKMLIELKPLKERYNKLERELFELFNSISKGKL